MFDGVGMDKGVGSVYFFMLSDFFRHGKRYVIENVFIAFINRTSLGKYFIYMCI